MDGICVIVDQSPAGTLLAGDFFSRGLSVVSPKELGTEKPVAVVPATAEGFQLANQLSAIHGLPRNGNPFAPKVRQATSANFASSFIEYYLHSVSCQGKHRFSDIWKRKIRKEGETVVEDRLELMPYHSGILDLLRAKATEILTEQGIAVGAARLRFTFKKEKPMLLSFSPVLHLTAPQEVFTECLGVGPVELTADAYVAPQAFFEKTGKPYALRKYSVMASSQIDSADKLRRLRSFFKVQKGTLSLVHYDSRTVRSDYEQFRLIESRD